MMTQLESSLSTSAKVLLRRLRAGQRWLTEQHRLWLADDPKAATDERFSWSLAAWDAMEQVFRCSGYTGCIWGPDGHCPDDAPVICDGCLGKAEAEPVTPAAQLELVIGGVARDH